MAETQVASAGQGVIASQAQRDMARKQFDDAVITAPFNGTVNKKFESVGTVAAPGNEIYEVVADGAMKIDATLPERFLKDVTVGTPVSVTIPNADCKLEPQTISLVYREISDSTGNFGVTINLKDANGCLRHGMFAHLSFEVAKRSGVLSLPVEAIIELSGNKVVYVAENGKAVKKQVTTGLTSKELVEISSGLTGNEDVILSGNRYVVDGSLVRVIGKEGSKADGSNADTGDQNPR